MKKEQKVIFAKFQNGQNMPSNRTWWSKILVKKKKGRFVELRQRSERFATHIIALTTEYLEEWMIIIYIDDKCFFLVCFFSHENKLPIPWWLHVEPHYKVKFIVWGYSWYPYIQYACYICILTLAGQFIEDTLQIFVLPYVPSKYLAHCCYSVIVSEWIMSEHAVEQMSSCS